MMSDLSHFDDQGASRMVDTGGKPETERVARASGRLRALPATIALIRDKALAKGDVREVARLAGISAMEALKVPAAVMDVTTVWGRLRAGANFVVGSDSQVKIHRSKVRRL